MAAKPSSFSQAVMQGVASEAKKTTDSIKQTAFGIEPPALVESDEMKNLRETSGAQDSAAIQRLEAEMAQLRHQRVENERAVEEVKPKEPEAYVALPQSSRPEGGGGAPGHKKGTGEVGRKKN